MSGSTTDDVWEAPDKSFRKAIKQPGTAFKKPQQRATCSLKVLSDEEGIVVIEGSARSKVIIIGDISSDLEYILETCALTMNEGEICDLSFKIPLSIAEPYIPKASYLVGSPVMKNCVQVTDSSRTEDSNNQQPEKINGSSQLTQSCTDIPRQNLPCPRSYKIRIQLESVVLAPAIFEMVLADKWQQACQHKTKGAELYAAKNYRWAFGHFRLAYKYLVSLEHDSPSEDEVNELGLDILGLKVKCLLNLAACQLHNGTYHHVVTNCTRALEIEPENVKALFRRGSALIQLQEYENAKGDLEKAVVLDPKNLPVKQQMALLKQRMQMLDKYFAGAMKKLFQ